MTKDAERANHPQWSGTGYEIWFFVVLVPGTPRALWVRMTRFADAETSDSRVWAVLSEGGALTVEREVLPLDALTVESVPFALRVGETELGHGSARGRCGALRWDLRFEPSRTVAERLPQLPRFLPVPTHAVHPHAEAPVTGFVELDGRRISLDGGRLTQMHIWGSKRVEWLRWIWAPAFDGADGALELTAVAPRANGPGLCALWGQLDGVALETPGLARAARERVETVRPDLLHHASARGGRRVVVRAWADDATFAGWDYRHVGGGQARVAQSDLATCEVEIYRRRGLGWCPEKRLRSRSAAIELHGPEAFPSFHYVPWDAAPSAAPRVDASAPREPDAPVPGTWIDTPRPTRIVALGLTYRAHADETANELDPVVFEVDPAAWTSGEPPIVRPSTERLRDALAALDPSLPDALRDFGFLPAMLDYEVEVGLVFLDGLDDAEAPGRVGFVLTNDVTARTLQVLGEGQPNRLAYWSAAKSFPSFAPTAARAFVPAHLPLDAWPALRLETRVNGALRQSATLDQLVETPRQMLARVLRAAGPLPAGTLLSTGTPAGIALSVPRWKKAVGERLFDRVGRLRVALAGFAKGTAFLRPGDEVEVSAGFLGRIRQRVIAE